MVADNKALNQVVASLPLVSASVRASSSDPVQELQDG